MFCQLVDPSLQDRFIIGGLWFVSLQTATLTQNPTRLPLADAHLVAYMIDSETPARRT